MMTSLYDLSMLGTAIGEAELHGPTLNELLGHSCIWFNELGHVGGTLDSIWVHANA